MYLYTHDYLYQGCFYVVFQDETSLWWLHLLKKNFRHCYVLLPMEQTNSYLELNPFSNQFVVRQYSFGASFDYLQALRQQGKLVCEVTTINTPNGCAPWFFFTCVEFVKRFMGLHDCSIITPYQLYQKISKSNCRLP